MAELKVTSKKYNDKDVLEVEGDVLATKIEVSNIEALTDAQLNALKVGDVVEKKTGNQKHCYIVSYKEEKHGICLTYVDCGYMETVSYDYVDGSWVFNSKDTLRDVDLKVKTLGTREPNWEMDLKDLIEAKSSVGATYKSLYSKMVQFDNVLYIVINYTITAVETGSYGGDILDITNIPTEIGEKLFDMKGYNLTEEGDGEASVTILFGGRSENGASSWTAITNAFFNHNGANAIKVYLGQGGSISAGSTRYYTIRNFVILS